MGNANRKQSEVKPPVESLCKDLSNLSLANVGNKEEEKQEFVKEASSSSSADESSNEKIESSDDDDDEANPCLYSTALEETPVKMDEEDVVAQYHGKLYRFESEIKQWQEKGVGKICILQSLIQKQQYRVVMWVDRTGRVACNFRLFPEFVVTNDPGNPKTARWQALDFSDADQPKWGTFAFKFSTLDRRDDFRTKLTKYSLEYVPSEDSKTGTNCPGCVGCNPETFEFPQSMQVHGKFECIIDCKLEFDSYAEAPITVKPEMFK